MGEVGGQMFSIFRFAALVILGALLVGCGSVLPPPTPTVSPLAQEGRVVFKTYCSRCHETSGETVIVGPSLAGIATRGETRRENMDTEAYIRDSIMYPSAYTVEGFVEGTMPINIREEMTEEEFEAVVAFLLSLE